MNDMTKMETADVVEVRKKPRWRLALMLSVPLLLLAVGAYFWLTSGRFVSTDNAYVQQDMVSVAPEVTGPIAEVFVKENQPVKKGDLLFRIDQRPFKIALAQANVQIANAAVQVNELTTKSAGMGADIEAAQANLKYEQENFARYKALLARGFTTRTQYDSAYHDLTEAQQRLANAHAAAANAQSALAGGGTQSQPAIEAAKVARDQALLNLARTEVHAPADGFASQTSRLQVGNMAVQGVPMVTVVQKGSTYIEANYKETDLANMFPGQPADLKFDAYPGVKIRGHVQSIGRGTGSQFSVLPAQNATGNWVKVTQRVPVRIVVDGDPGRPLLAGLSVKATVDTKQRPAQLAAK